MLEKKVTTRLKKLVKEAKIPVYATDGDSGADLFSIDAVMIEPGARVLIHTGIAIALPDYHEAEVRSKSGLALKAGITVLNSPGTVDEGYRGEIGVILYNAGHEDYCINPGDKVAQLVIKPVYQTNFVEVAELDETERGEGGFGHNGK